MESGERPSTAPAPGAALEEPSVGPDSSSPELPRADPGKFQALPLGPGGPCKDPDPGSPGSPTAGDGPPDAGPAGEPSGGAKIPNRDSGIDSPSCSVAGEHFPCEEGGEASPVPTVPGLHPQVAPEGRALREEADSDDVGEGSGEEPDPKNGPPRARVDTAKRSEPQKLLHIAQELLHTEETYVRRLHLLDQVFCTQLVEAGIPPEVTTGIFSNISSIYRFHGQFLLPELQTRITEEWPASSRPVVPKICSSNGRTGVSWMLFDECLPFEWSRHRWHPWSGAAVLGPRCRRDTTPRLGDILQKLAPFLKMYGEYVKNFDRAVELVSTWTQRSPLFKEVVQGIQKQEVCGNLTLQHHMLEPVQRVPRYELLLKDYLKRLPGDAPDRKDAERSLELISTAANHSNAAIRKMEKMHKLLEVYERLGGEEDIVNPANELIKEGHILKLSAKNGTAQDRQLFLFNSMILYCVPKLRLMGQKFSVREKMDISDLQVQDTIKPNAPHTFVITGRKRSLELQTRTEEEKKEWIQVIEATIERHRQNSQTFKAFGGSFSQDEDPSPAPESPVVSASAEDPAGAASSGGATTEPEPRRGSAKTRRDKDKQGCRSCGETFNSITKRKHRCKLCGAVICGKCSEFKAENGRQSRVCRECFLTQQGAPETPSPEKPLAVDARPSLLCGHLRVSDSGAAWSEVWATIPASEPLELVLYLQGGSQASRLPRSIPLSGCKVSVPDPTERPDTGHVWRLHQAQQTLYLSAPSAELQQRWLEALSAAAHGDPALAFPGAP
ncbi:FYVE, RhoGEF and PH domain-containing protein 3 isoform X2 [Crocuta crocuta]